MRIIVRYGGWPRAAVRGVRTMLISCLCASKMVGPAISHDALVESFRDPPPEARPQVWWHWMNGNVNEDGVRADLTWMKRVGIGGVQNFDAAFERGDTYDTPRVVNHPLSYLTPSWQRVFRDSVALANSLGLEYAIASAPGWSETGGPWVAPSQAMKKLVWSESALTGGVTFDGCLKSPPRITGYFQNIPLRDAYGARAGEVSRLPTYYGEVATVAYRVPPSEGRDLKPSISTSAGDVRPNHLFDGDLSQPLTLPYGTSSRAWVMLRFARRERIRALTISVSRRLSDNPLGEPGPTGWLEASSDGAHFHKIVDLPRSNRDGDNSALEQTITFPPVAARIFRLVLERDVQASSSEDLNMSSSGSGYGIAQLVLHAAPRVNRFEDKAGFSARQIGPEDDTPEIIPREAVKKRDIVDLSDRVDPNGCMHWTPPRGRWIVLRFGYSLTGSLNHPASSAATGLEVDKLNRIYVKTYMDTYLDKYEHMLGSNLMGSHGLKYMVTDSYEAGPQNWTDSLPAEFKARRGYDLRPWLPTLAGRVVESASASDRFLWDFRKTLSELMAEAHYGQITASLHERGIARYGESHEYNRAFVGDGMEAKKSADIPMGAMWANQPENPESDFDADLHESASVAHVYGRKLVAAESFTAYGNSYGFAPEDLKPVADRIFALGANRIVIHTSVHQPDHFTGPGLGLGPFGQWFTRNETWAEQARGWADYLARSSYLLQQGRSFADIAYLYGEDTNLTSLFFSSAPSIPEGFNFDFINTDVLMNELSVKNGYWVTRSGMRYRLLALDPNLRRITVAALGKLQSLVRAGGTIVGIRPNQTPTLVDNGKTFSTLVSAIWGQGVGDRVVGQGRVFSDISIDEALHKMKVSPEIEVVRPNNLPLRFVHRVLETGDLYFITSSNVEPQVVDISLRTSGKKPEVWRAGDGSIAPASYRIDRDRTVVSVHLERNDALFIILRKPTTSERVVFPQPAVRQIGVLDGSWNVSFPPHLGAPAHAQFDHLYSWTQSQVSGIRYYSGSAIYDKVLYIANEWLTPNSQILIDLGTVKNLAELRINGITCGDLWKAPFRVNVTRCVKRGENVLEVRITNLWPNRLIGDKQPAAQRIAFAAYDPFKSDSPLMPSGLLGPVTLWLESWPGQ